MTTSADPSIQRGDVILSIDGRAATQLLADGQMQISGAPQWRTIRALRRLGRGPRGSSVDLRLRRDQHELTVTVARIDRSTPEAPLSAPIAQVEDGVYYVDLSRAELSELEAALDRLVAARGVIFDLRDRPRYNHDILSHVLTHVDDLGGWESIPLIIHPDSPTTPAAWEDASAFNMPLLSVKQPHIAGRVAFLTGPLAISYPESRPPDIGRAPPTRT